METLPHLPIKIILENLTFDEILNLLWTPKWRDTLLEYYSKEMNMKDLIKLGLLEIFDKLVRKTRYLSEYIHDFLTTQGMKPYYKEKEYREIQFRLFCSFTQDELYNAFPKVNVDELNKLNKTDKRLYFEEFVKEDTELYKIRNRVLLKNVLRRIRRNTIYERVEQLEGEVDNFLNEHTAKFLEKFLYDPSLGFKNTLLLFENLPQIEWEQKIHILREYGTNKPSRLLNFLEKIFVGNL